MRTPDPQHVLMRMRTYARQMAGGDLSALGLLFDLVGARLVRYACAILRNTSDSEDAVQAAMIRLACHPEALADAEFPWAYCLRVVRNESLRLLSKQRPSHGLPTEQVVAPHWRWSVEEEEIRQQVATAIQQLPAEQAEVVVLKIWENLTFLEIAEVIGGSANTAASRYRYALEKLERSLGALAQEVSYAAP